MYDTQLLHPHNKGSLSKLFARHFVSLIVMGRWPNGTTLRLSYSAFVFSVGEQWHLMTAGHNIEDLKSAAHKGGLHPILWQLADSFAGGPYARTVPIDGNLDDWASVYDESEPGGIDLAATRLHEFHTRALEANGVVPLDLGADFQRLSVQPCQQLYVVGVPQEKSSLEGSKVSQGLYGIPALGITEDQVVAVLKGPFKRHYGCIAEEALQSVDLKNIVGTSGGPVLGIWFFDEGRQFDYAAIGIQSGWDEPSRQIAAWPLDRLSRLLAEEASTAPGGLKTANEPPQ